MLDWSNGFHLCDELFLTLLKTCRVASLLLQLNWTMSLWKLNRYLLPKVSQRISFFVALLSSLYLKNCLIYTSRLHLKVLVHSSTVTIQWNFPYAATGVVIQLPIWWSFWLKSFRASTKRFFQLIANSKSSTESINVTSLCWLTCKILVPNELPELPADVKCYPSKVWRDSGSKSKIPLIHICDIGHVWYIEIRKAEIRPCPLPTRPVSLRS